MILTTLEKFREYVIQTLENLNSVIDTVTKISKGFGHISFTFLQVLGTSYVPKITKQFLEANPEKKIQFNFTQIASVPKQSKD